MPELNDPLPTSIAGNFKEFSDIIKLEKADPDQREFARRCFYAGSCSMLALVTQGISAMNENDAVVAFSWLERESVDHLRALMSGDA